MNIFKLKPHRFEDLELNIKTDAADAAKDFDVLSEKVENAAESYEHLTEASSGKVENPFDKVKAPNQTIEKLREMSDTIEKIRNLKMDKLFEGFMNVRGLDKESAVFKELPNLFEELKQKYMEVYSDLDLKSGIFNGVLGGVNILGDMNSEVFEKIMPNGEFGGAPDFIKDGVIPSEKIADNLASISKLRYPGTEDLIKEMQKAYALQNSGIDRSVLSTPSSMGLPPGKLTVSPALTGNLFGGSDAMEDLRTKLSPTLSGTFEGIKLISDEDIAKINEFTNNVGDMEDAVGEVGEAATKTKSSFNEWLSDITSFITRIRILISGIKSIGKAIYNFVMTPYKKMAAYQESQNLFLTTFGNKSQEMVEWATKISDALYLDPNTMIQYTGEIYNLITGMGIATDTALDMSKNLSQLAIDMASFLNIGYEDSYKKIVSAMTGQSRAIVTSGIPLQAATVEEYARSKGIDKSVNSMTQAEKTLLRYMILMDSTKTAIEGVNGATSTMEGMQMDLGRTLSSSENALKALKQQWENFVRTLGYVFIPIINVVLPYLMALTELAKEGAIWLAKLVGIDTSNWDFENHDYSSLKELQTIFDDTADSADEAADSINRSLAPFDDLNVVESSGSSGAGDSIMSQLYDLINSGDYGYNILDQLSDELSTSVENAKKKLLELFNIAKLVMPFLIVGTIAKGWFDLTKGISSVSNALTTIGIEGAAEAGTAAIGLVTVLAGVLIAAIGIAFSWKGIKEALENNGWDSSSLTKFGIGVALVLVGGFVIGAGIAILAGASALTGGLIGLLVAGIIALVAFLVTTVIAYWDDISAFFANLWEVIKGVLSALWDGIKAVFGFIWDIVKVVFGFLWDCLKAYINFWIEVYTKAWEIVKTVFTFIWDIVKKVFEFTWNIVSTVIGGIIDFFKQLWDVVKIVFENIWEIVKKVFEIIWVQISTYYKTIFKILKGAATFVYNYVIKPIWDFITNFVKNVATAFVNIVTTIKDKVITPIINLFKGLIDKVLGFFKDIGSAVANAFSAAFRSVLNGAFTIVEGLINGFIKGLNGVISIINAIPGVDIGKIELLKIPRFENGGMPDSGDLFFANENGAAEYITSIGNRTAVANQDQMVQAITGAITQSLGNMNNRNGDVVVYIGNDKVYQGQGSYQSRQSDRYGTTYVKI